MPKNIVEVENLSKSFGHVEAVKNVSFHVPEGITFGFLGPNGAGKSTTIKILCTLLKPTRGRVILNGCDVVANPKAVRRSIGIVFQDPSLDENLTATENLFFHAVLFGVPRSVIRERIKQVLDLVELYDRKDSIVKTFSGGMKRRLEIARGLLHYPKVLFLDEPTIGLDPQTRAHIWDYIGLLQKRENITIFLTTHYMEEAENCSQIAVIDNGEIVAEGTPEKLKREFGSEFLEIKAIDNEAAFILLKEQFGDKVILDRDRIILGISEGEKALYKIGAVLQGNIISVLVHKPTLNDVFLNLTGRNIRDENLTSGREIMIQKRRARRR
ncbi:daunorubicin resistance ABC transporter ATPase subunit [Thermincola ferriacetica]|uniref:Daunorubicin resistance ABC transporter ATPase subunit n=2 Tax=Thermincola TaxID=278993 RepID=D5X874_THEPJ|nr:MULTISPECIES: daunorubicin resistance protein DrrA family ABC transporter ATP-binding protein [Thermincola]ADG82794.1 daunorubicin resistance ABC transporter ATPase subunit [Thermincola potens JR]KNZ70253.1 daunorubicin resistance ABC transporter ATPase subunit [Thermincola ferriacetica]